MTSLTNIRVKKSRTTKLWCVLWDGQNHDQLFGSRYKKWEGAVRYANELATGKTRPWF